MREIDPQFVLVSMVTPLLGLHSIVTSNCVASGECSSSLGIDWFCVDWQVL